MGAFTLTRSDGGAVVQPPRKPAEAEQHERDHEAVDLQSGHGSTSPINLRAAMCNPTTRIIQQVPNADQYGVVGIVMP